MPGTIEVVNGQTVISVGENTQIAQAAAAAAATSAGAAAGAETGAVAAKNEAITTALAYQQVSQVVLRRPGLEETHITVGGKTVVLVDSTGLNTAEFKARRGYRKPLSYTVASAPLLMSQDYGQSNGSYIDANPALTTVARANSNVIFNGGAYPSVGGLDAEVSIDPSDYTSFVPAVSGPTNESAMVVAVNYERTLSALRGEAPSDQAWLAVSAAHGGAPASGLVKFIPETDPPQPTPKYAAMAYQWGRAKLLDDDAKLFSISYTQGESDQNQDTPAATYKTYVVSIHEDAQTDAQAVFEQTEAVPMLMCQTSLDTQIKSTIPQAQNEICAENERIHYICSIAHCDPHGSALHLSNKGQAIRGGYDGRAKRDMRDGWEPQFLEPVGAILRGTELRIAFNVPWPPMVFDTVTIPPIQDNGIRVTDNGTTIAISKMYAEGDEVVIILGAEPSGTVLVRIALDYTHPSLGIASRNIAITNLRDSAPDKVLTGGELRPLYNWGRHEIIAVTKVED